MMDQKMMMEVPTQVRELAEKTVNQAEKAFEAFLTAANQSVAMIPGPTTEMSKKTLSLTEKNMKAAFDHARQLVHAKDMQEAIEIAKMNPVFGSSASARIEVRPIKVLEGIND